MKGCNTLVQALMHGWLGNLTLESPTAAPSHASHNFMLNLYHNILKWYHTWQALLHGWLGNLSYRCSLALAAGSLMALAAAVVSVSGIEAYIIPIFKAICLAIGAVTYNIICHAQCSIFVHRQEKQTKRQNQPGRLGSILTRDCRCHLNTVYYVYRKI